MAAAAPSGVFPPSVTFRMKLLRALETAGQYVLTYTLQCGTVGKCPTVTLEDYLKSLPDSSTARFKKLTGDTKRKFFNKDEKQQISRDASCSTFDVSLLAKSITAACEDLEDDDDILLLVKEVKDTRNAVVHETHVTITDGGFLTRLEELRNIFLKTLEACKVKYSTDAAECDDKKKEVENIVKEIRTQILSEEEILQKSAPVLLQYFQKDAHDELRRKLSSATLLDPLRFLSDHEDRRVDVQEIFSKIIIKEDRRKEKDIHHLDLLTLAEGGSGRPAPHFLAVEGDAGSGKSTLQTYILSEYLHEETDRKMKNLNKYDLLLWVVCRQETNTTLESLVTSLLSNASIKYGNLLMPLLKLCKVLILVDGWDELSNKSRSLVEDVLNQCKDSPNATVLATSRPEAVQAMKANTPATFVLHHLKLEGVAIDERAELALRHYRWLCGGVPEDEARILQALQEICWKELFRLPLNLLFLATVFHNEPQKVTTSINQTELYRKILDWCVGKLEQRLAARQQVFAGVFLEEKIKRFLTGCYEVALKGLTEERLHLNDEEVRRLVRICKEEGLPGDEVLPAFYALRREASGGKKKQRYYAPHKGLQDFFAAQYVCERVSTYTQGDIRRVLQDSTPGQDPQLKPLRNTLVHIMGLLSSQDDPILPAIEETVDLLQDTGMSDAGDWLVAMADTEAHESAVQRAAHHINKNTGRAVWVRDGTVKIAVKTLPYIHPSEVVIQFKSDKTKIEKLIPALGDHTLVRIFLEHHYRHPGQGFSTDILQQVPRGNLTHFMGRLHAQDLSLLPPSLEALFLVVASDGEARSLLPPLKHIKNKLPALIGLSIHVPVSAVTAASLTSLPHDGPGVGLDLSGVNEQHVEAAVRVTAALCPGGRGYGGLSFPGAEMGAEGWWRLMEGLKAASVAVWGWVLLPRTAQGYDGLDTLVTTSLGCQEVEWKGEEGMWGWSDE